MKILGVDFGYGYMKYFDGKSLIKTISLVAPSRKLKFFTGMSKEESLSNLDVEIDGNRYFVGDLARRQGIDPFQVLDKDKVFHETTKIMLYTFLAKLGGDDLRVVTGLPVSYYDEEKIIYLKNLLKGKHFVSFYEGENKINKDFNVKDVLVIPQPIGTFFDFILDKNGNPVKEIDLENFTMGVIDIGFGTTDFAVVRNLEYIDKSSRSISIGVKDLLELLREEVALAVKEELALYELEDFVIDEKKKISLRGKTLDIESMINKDKITIFSKLKTISDYFWDKERAIDMYIVTGGGSHLFGELFKKVYGSKTHIELVKNPSFANVSGFYKYGMRRWKYEVNG